jgi:hypothetical protein
MFGDEFVSRNNRINDSVILSRIVKEVYSNDMVNEQHHSRFNDYIRKNLRLHT